MKVRLLANDSKIPNIAIMKISTYHKRLGDDVAWYNPIFDYEDTDILYHSQIFTFTPKYQYYPINAKIIKGGTGFDIKSALPAAIDKIVELDYSLYPECNYSIQFLSRGCIRNCKFCVVRAKEGLIHKVEPLSLNPDGKYIMLLDNNFFACKEWRDNIEILKKYNQPIDFNQGIDLRLLTEEQCIELKKLKIKTIHCAWDNYQDKDIIIPKLELLCRYIKPYKITCYVLVGFESTDATDIENAFKRIELLMRYQCLPYIMRYQNKNHSPWKDSKLKNLYIALARWGNQPSIFKKMSFRQFCEANQALRKSPDKLCSSMQAMTEFEKENPTIAETYFNLRYDDYTLDIKDTKE